MSKQKMQHARPKANPQVLGRVLKMLFRFYPVLVPIVIVCILVSAVTAALPAVFMQQVIAEIEVAQQSGISWQTAAGNIDYRLEPPMYNVGGKHRVSTWLADEREPKVEMPEALKRRIEKMKKASVTEDE